MSWDPMSPEAEPMTNPLLEPFSGPFGLPPFAALSDADFGPAFDVTFKEASALISVTMTT